MSEVMDQPMVTINWCPADLVVGYGFEDEDAIHVLERIAKSLHDRSIELGWEVLDVLVQDYIEEK